LSTGGESEQAFDTQPSGNGGRLTDRAPATYDERLNHILAAATDLIAHVGYERATMRGVAHAAGVSLAGLYHYFPAKERMLFLIQYRTFSDLVSKLREKLHGVDDPVEQLRVVIRTHVGYFAANMAALKVCSHELDSLTGSSYEETRRIRSEYYTLVRAIVERLLEMQPPAGPFDRHVATMSLFGMLNWLYRWYDPHRDRSPTVVANQVAAQFLHGLLGSSLANGAAGAPPEVGRTAPTAMV
jgi:AcrR family transcriptional regulator